MTYRTEQTAQVGGGGSAPVVPAWKREGTVYVVGVDGLTLDVVDPMVERGELPNFALLSEKGSHGPLATIWPTNSPLVWTSIATGRHHRDHGIDGFQFYSVLGFHLSRSTVRKYKKLGLRKLGFNLVIGLLKLLGLRKRHYFDGRHIRTKTFWDIVGEAGGRVGVINWWYSWPARPVNGFVVSDKLHYWRAAHRGKAPIDTHLTYPDGLLDEMRGLIVPPDQIEPEELGKFINLPDRELREMTITGAGKRDPVREVRFLLSADRTYARAFEHCLDAFPELQLAAIYFRGPDIAQHCAFDYMPSSVASDATPEERGAFGEVVPQVYRFADELIGKVIARLRPQDTLFVVSDHGYGYQENAGRRGPYGHALGQPPGVLYACGWGFKKGVAIRHASIYDVAPTVLRVSGFPTALDMEGRCLEELLTDEFRAEYPPPDPVATYGPRLRRSDTATMSAELEKELTDHLRHLGYLD